MAGMIDAAIVGQSVGPIACSVDARWLMAYAAALGETDARYYDSEARGGPLAHPLFPVCYEWPVALALRAKTIEAALGPLAVHATHHALLHRPPRAGDSLRTTGRIFGVERRRAGTLVVARYTTTDRTGVLVSTTEYGSLYRGIELRGDEVRLARVDSSAGPVRWEERVTVPLQAAHVYTECARIYNPIHTDIAVARAAGLPGLIMHGTATLALAVSRVVARDLDGDPTRVQAVGARFTGMVTLPSTLLVRGRDGGAGIAFDAVTAEGVEVVADGTVATP
jgi:acyl dehydratase